MFKLILTLGAVTIPVLLAFLVYELWTGSRLAMAKFGFDFITSSTWDPVAEQFGAFPLIFGTLVSSLIALVIAVPLSLGVAIYLTEFAPRAIRQPVAFLISLLAAIPSVVYGLWGIFVLIPLLRKSVFPFLRDATGISALLPGAHLRSVDARRRDHPRDHGDAVHHVGLARGAAGGARIPSARRRWRSAPRAGRRSSRRWFRTPAPASSAPSSSGSAARSGETMAVTMLIGNRHEMAASLFAPGYTMAAAIANEFSEAVGDMHLSALAYVAFLLFIVTVLVNAGARLLIWRVARGSGVGSKAL